MGGVESYNHVLMNSVDYTNKKSVRRIIGSYYLLEDLCRKGDQVAMSIYIDITEAMDGKNSTLTEEERTYIKANLIDGRIQSDIAEEHEVGQRDVSTNIRTGIKKIVDILTSGELYE